MGCICSVQSLSMLTSWRISYLQCANGKNTALQQYLSPVDATVVASNSNNVNETGAKLLNFNERDREEEENKDDEDRNVADLVMQLRDLLNKNSLMLFVLIWTDYMKDTLKTS